MMKYKKYKIVDSKFSVINREGVKDDRGKKDVKEVENEEKK